MFWGKKKEENRHIIAVKNYTDFLKVIKDGSLYLPFNKDIYLKLLENNSTSVDNLKELGKFAKECNKQKNEITHFWGGLVTNGYTLVNVKYDEKDPSIEKLCFSDSIKYVSDVSFK